MIDDPSTYAIADFIPFTADVYLRLIERQHEALRPLQFVTLPLAVGAVILAQQRWGRSLAVVLSVAWAGVALTYHLPLLAEVTFAAEFIAGAFIAQAVVMIVCGLRGGLTDETKRRPLVPAVVGFLLAGVGVLVFPLLGPLHDRGWVGSELVGMAPDPTVVVTLGVLVVAARPIWLLLLLPIPVLWCAVSAAVDVGFDLPLAWMLPAAAGLTIVAGVWKTFRT